MTILKTIQCDVCGKESIETDQCEGWVGCVFLQGVVLNDIPNPSLCPECLPMVAAYVDNMAEAYKEVSK